MPPRRTPRRLFIAPAVALVGAVALAACGGGSGPSVASPRQQVSTTSSSTTSTTTSTVPTTAPASTTTTTAVPAGEQLVTYSGLRFEVPSSWPVYQLSSDPNRCVRFDVHAVYLGATGPTPQCPALLVGRTEAVQVEPLNPQSPAVQLATQVQTLNGLSVRLDPNASANGEDTVVFPDLGVVAVIAFRTAPNVATQILQSFQHA